MTNLLPRVHPHHHPSLTVSPSPSSAHHPPPPPLSDGRLSHTSPIQNVILPLPFAAQIISEYLDTILCGISEFPVPYRRGFGARALCYIVPPQVHTCYIEAPLFVINYPASRTPAPYLRLLTHIGSNYPSCSTYEYRTCLSTRSPLSNSNHSFS